MKIDNDILNSLLKSIDDSEYFEQSLNDFKSSLAKIKNPIETNSSSNSNDSLVKEFKPGRIVELDIKGERYFGIILISNTIVYVNNIGEIKGYLHNFTFTNDCPYKIHKILIPTDKWFQLKDYNKMEVAWQKPKDPITVKMSIKEIENKLGLLPGSLKIY